MDSIKKPDGNTIYLELKQELEKLKSREVQREVKLNQLATENRKIKERLMAIEHLLSRTELSLTPKEYPKCFGQFNKIESIETADQNDGNKNQHLLKTFIELSSKCGAINKKFKYLRRLMKLNNQKLADIETQAKAGNDKNPMEKEDKYCQVVLSDREEEKRTAEREQEKMLKDDSSDSDSLMSEIFYLPTHPDLPDMRLFSLI